MAAGLGFKTFTTGEVLTAGDTNGYLMQGVLVFADAAARSAAITSPQEGQTSYLKSDDTIYTYSGSAWVAAGGLPSQTGNSGKYLTTDGTNPSWGTVAAGGLTVIASGSLTGSQVNLTSIPATYKNLRLVVRKFIPATDGDVLALRLQNDSNSRYRTTPTSSSPSNAQTWASTSFIVNASQDDTVSESLIVIDFQDYANTLTWKMASITAINNNQTTSTNYNAFTGTGFYNQTTAISEINLFNSAAGSFNGGTYILYGVS